jgi:hypothetical protein
METQKGTCAFVFPVHRDKFKYGRRLIKSYNDLFSGIDIYPIFSNEEEQEEFALNNPDLSYTPIIYDLSYNPTLQETSGIITKKKFYAIDELFSKNNYKYIAAIDSESSFTSSADVSKLFKEWHNKKKFYSSTTHKIFHRMTLEDPAGKFFPEHYETLRSALNNFCEFFWFNEIPIYERETFQRFKDITNIFNKFRDITWVDFDYHIYGLYCILYEGFEVVSINRDLGYDIEIENGFLEDQFLIESSGHSDVWDEICDIIRPMWIKYPRYTCKSPFMTTYDDRRV